MNNKKLQERKGTLFHSEDSDNDISNIFKMRVTLDRLLVYVDSETLLTRRIISQYLTYFEAETVPQLSIQDIHRVRLLVQIYHQKVNILNGLRKEIEEIYSLYDQRVQQDIQMGQLRIRMMNMHETLRLCLLQLTETSEIITID